jgi:uncharacterized protein YndB with AHSA1/START domain
MNDAPEKRDGKPRHGADEYGAVSGRGTFRIERVLPGPIERVWTYLTDPEKRRKWLASGKMDLRVGGRVELRFRFSELSPDQTPSGQASECHVNGHITRIDSPHLLSYTWGDQPEASEVTFELFPHGQDVLLVITHRRLGDRGTMVSVASGWHTHLGILTDHLSGQQVRPFWPTKIRMATEYKSRLEDLTV